jgi:hypothetical protein
MSRMSRLPPTRRGGTTEWSPGSAGATPMVPVKGLSGILAWEPHRAGAMVWASYLQTISAGSTNWSARSPKPGMFAVQPQAVPSRGCGAKLSSVTFSASPGSAPSTQMGPETGLILPKSRSITSCSVEEGPSWPAEESWQWNRMVEPGRTLSAGASELSQPKWCCRPWIV